MKKVVIIVFLSAFLCLSSYHPVWAEGWGNTSWGMDIQQVETATKDKVISSEGKDPNDPKKVFHRLQNDISIGEHSFVVNLKFVNNKLAGVHLSNSASNASSAYFYLLEELKKKYGPPTTEPKSEKSTYLLSSSTQWITQGTVISLSNSSLFFQGKSLYSTTVQYAPRQSAASGTL